MDPGSQRRQSHHRAVFRAEKPRAIVSTNWSPPRAQARARNRASCTSITSTDRPHPRPQPRREDHYGRGPGSRRRAPSSRGTFPGFPIMPGVLLIEAMAQSLGLAVARADEVRAHAVPGRRSRKPRCAASSVPVELLTIEAKRRARRFRFCGHRGQGPRRRANCSAAPTLTFSHVPFPNPALRVHMDADGQARSASRCRR